MWGVQISIPITSRKIALDKLAGEMTKESILNELHTRRQLLVEIVDGLPLDMLALCDFVDICTLCHGEGGKDV